jgi:hypothetical protein
MDLEGPAPGGKKEVLVSWFCYQQYGNTICRISLAFYSKAWIYWCISCNCRNSHFCRSASLGGLERSAALEERRSTRRLKSFQSPRSKPDLPGLPLSRAQPARAGPPSFRIRCHRPAYSAELAGTQNPLPKPCHWLIDRPSELIYLRFFFSPSSPINIKKCIV